MSSKSRRFARSRVAVNGMNELTAFKNKILLYGIITALLVQLFSLPFLGLNAKFGYGLALGTSISIVNFNIMEFTMKKALSGGGAFVTFIGYMIRLMIYGGSFYISMKVSTISGLATLLGFLTLKASIYYLHGFKAKFTKDRKVRPEVKAAYDRMDTLKSMHKTGRIRDKIRNELNFREEDFFSQEETKETAAGLFSEVAGVKPEKTDRTYKRKKLRK